MAKPAAHHFLARDGNGESAVGSVVELLVVPESQSRLWCSGIHEWRNGLEIRGESSVDHPNPFRQR
jgi:hypothetical protein